MAHSARREVLCDLANVGDLPLPQTGPSQKRARGDEGTAAPSAATADDAALANGVRSFAGSKRVSAAYAGSTPGDSPNPSDSTSSMYSPPMDFVLPVHSDELGRIPIFQQPPPPQQQQQQAPAAGGAWGHFDMTPSIFGAPGPDAGALGSTSMPPPPAPFAAPPLADTHFADFAAFAPLQQQQQQTVHAGLEPADAGFALPASRGGDTLSMWSTAPEGFE